MNDRLLESDCADDPVNMRHFDTSAYMNIALEFPKHGDFTLTCQMHAFPFGTSSSTAHTYMGNICPKHYFYFLTVGLHLLGCLVYGGFTFYFDCIYTLSLAIYYLIALVCSVAGRHSTFPLQGKGSGTGCRH
jgi:hypothetical protein